MLYETSDDRLTKAKNYAYRVLSYRSRSTKELRTKLEKKKFPKHTTRRVIKALERLKFLDDRQFARTFIETRFLRNPCGRRLIEQELKRKGIDEELIRETCDEAFTANTEYELAKSLALRKVARYKDLDESAKWKKLYGLLGRRGFPPELIHEVAEEVLGARE